MLGKPYVYSTKYRDLYCKETGEVLGYFQQDSPEPVTCQPQLVEGLFRLPNILDVVELEEN